MIAFSFDIFCVPKESTIVTIELRASGIAATASVRTRRSAVTLSLDNTAYDVADDTEIRVSLSEKRIFLGQAHNISFYDTLRDKMMWGVDIRD